MVQKKKNDKRKEWIKGNKIKYQQRMKHTMKEKVLEKNSIRKINK